MGNRAKLRIQEIFLQIKEIFPVSIILWMYRWKLSEELYGIQATLTFKMIDAQNRFIFSSFPDFILKSTAMYPFYMYQIKTSLFYVNQTFLDKGQRPNRHGDWHKKLEGYKKYGHFLIHLSWKHESSASPQPQHINTSAQQYSHSAY
ncbi:hypothetical protein ACJX0J_024666 [Zea mays]